MENQPYDESLELPEAEPGARSPRAGSAGRLRASRGPGVSVGAAERGSGDRGSAGKVRAQRAGHGPGRLGETPRAGSLVQAEAAARLPSPATLSEDDDEDDEDSEEDSSESDSEEDSEEHGAALEG